MAGENNTQAPQGVTFGDPVGQAPQGVTFGNPVTQQDIDSFKQQFGSEAPPDLQNPQNAVDIIKGAGEGALSTVGGVSSLLNKIPGIGETLAPKVGVNAMDELATPKNTAQKFGYAGETLTELLLGDETLKGLSLSEKLASAAAASKALEKFPNLVKYLKLGVHIGKSDSTLLPEELQFLKNHPNVAKLVGAGKEVLKQGGLVGGQTLERTGDPKQAAEDAALTGLMSAGVHGTGELADKIGGTAEKAQQTTESAANTMNEAKATAGALTTAAKPAASDIAETTAKQLNDAESKIHTDFETGINGIKNQLKGQQVTFKGSPLSKRADELLGKTGKKTTYDPALAENIREGTASKLDKPVKNLLDLISEGEIAPKASGEEDRFAKIALEGKELTSEEQEAKPLKPLTIDGLIDLRQDIRKLAEGYDRNDINSRTLRQLLHSVDDTIGSMDNGGAASDYKALREDYKNRIKYFDPEKPESKIIDKLQSGRSDEVMDQIFSGRDQRQKVNEVKSVLGEDKVTDLAKDSFLRMVDRNTENGELNVPKLIKDWQKLGKDPEARQEFFGDVLKDKQTQIDALQAGEVLTKAIQNRTGQIVPIFSRAMGATGGMIGSHMLGGGLGGEMAGGIIGMAAGAGGTRLATKVAESIASKPETWERLGLLLKGTSKLAKGTSSIINITQPYVSKALGANLEIPDTNTGKRNIMQGAAPSLAGSL